MGLDRSIRQDAYDISMGAILDIHHGGRSHDRVAPFVTCKQIPGGGTKCGRIFSKRMINCEYVYVTLTAGGRTMLQTFEECNVTAGAVKDPFHPPAVASVFLVGGKRGHSNGGQ